MTARVAKHPHIETKGLVSGETKGSREFVFKLMSSPNKHVLNVLFFFLKENSGWISLKAFPLL